MGLSTGSFVVGRWLGGGGVGGVHFGVSNLSLFRSFILSWSDSPEKSLPVSSLESQNLAASVLEPKLMKTVGNFGFQDANIHLVLQFSLWLPYP